jgi:hypothetical protein
MVAQNIMLALAEQHSTIIILFVITRMPGNPITGSGAAPPINPMGIAIEVLQAAFIGLLTVAPHSL